jgi:hypothetical protein
MKKGIFVTISVFFLALALLAVANVQAGSHEKQAQAYADLSDLSDVSAIRTNVEWMTKETYATSGFQYSIYNQTISIKQNDSKRGLLSNDLSALVVFWENVGDKNVSLDFSINASIPLIYIRPTNISIIQKPTNTSIIVPNYSNSSILSYFISIETNCSDLSTSWNNISESTASDALNFTIDIECIDSAETYSTFKQLERFDYSELQISDTGSNLSVIRILSPGSIEVKTYKSSYLNIIIPMIERVYYEIPATLNITKGNSRISTILAIPGDIE